MPATQTLTVDAVGNPEQVVTVSACRIVTVRQNDLNAAALLDFHTRAPLATSAPVLYPGGKTAIFDLGYYVQPGTSVCFIETVTGADVFCVEES